MIDDTFLEDLELNGYPVRIKKDLQEVISIFTKTFCDLPANMDWEAFERAFSLFQEVVEFEFRSVLFNDSRLLPSDAETIYTEINNSKQKLIVSIKTELNKSLPTFEKDFIQFRKELLEALKTAKNDKDKNDIKKSLVQIDKYLEQLKRMKVYMVK